MDKNYMDNCEKRRTPQAMYNQFKRPSAGSEIELYYIYRKILSLMSHVTIIKRMAT